MAQPTGVSKRKRAKRNRPYYNATSLAKFVGVHNAAAVEEIMKDSSGGFFPAYNAYYRDYYKSEIEDKRSQHGTAANVIYKGPELRQVVAALEAGEEKSTSSSVAREM